MTRSGLVLLLGATGTLGLEIARLLAANGIALRALVRETNPEKVSALHALGVQCVAGDLKVEASVAAACEGVTAVVAAASAVMSTNPEDTVESVDRVAHLRLIEQLRDSALRRFVYVSFPPVDVACNIQDAKRAVERSLAASGLPWVILHPAFFMETWLQREAGFAPRQGQASVYGTGEAPVSWISVHDVARAVMAALDSDEFNRSVLPLGGPDALSMHQVLEICAQLGAPVSQPTYIPEANLLAMQAGAPTPNAAAAAAIAVVAARGLTVDTREQLRLVPGRLLSARDFLSKALA